MLGTSTSYYLVLEQLFFCWKESYWFMRKKRPYKEALDCLRKTGLRPTRQRMGLAKLLFESGNRHVTAEVLHAEAAKANIKVSLATVYNTLHQFTDAGLLREIVVESGRNYFDTNLFEHFHMFNVDTRELVDFDFEKLQLTGLPELSKHQKVIGVDVMVRIKNIN